MTTGSAAPEGSFEARFEAIVEAHSKPYGEDATPLSPRHFSEGTFLLNTDSAALISGMRAAGLIEQETPDSVTFFAYSDDKEPEHAVPHVEYSANGTPLWTLRLGLSKDFGFMLGGITVKEYYDEDDAEPDVFDPIYQEDAIAPHIELLETLRDQNELQAFALGGIAVGRAARSHPAARTVPLDPGTVAAELAGVPVIGDSEAGTVETEQARTAELPDISTRYTEFITSHTADVPSENGTRRSSGKRHGLWEATQPLRSISFSQELNNLVLSFAITTDASGASYQLIIADAHETELLRFFKFSQSAIGAYPGNSSEIKVGIPNFHTNPRAMHEIIDELEALEAAGDMVAHAMGGAIVDYSAGAVVDGDRGYVAIPFLHDERT